MKVVFCTLASKDYFAGAERLFKSIRHHWKSDDLEFILFTDDVCVSDTVEGLFQRIIQIPNGSDGLISSETNPRLKFTLHKLSILNFFENNRSIDRLVFFDSDLLCTANLDYLLQPELNKFDFLAVRDFACEEYYYSEISKLGLDSKKIINSGVFILNRSLLRTLNSAIIDDVTSSSGKSYDGGDQGFFNYVIQNSHVKLGLLPLRFNYPLDPHYPFVARPPSLIHFTGQKPWATSDLATLLPWDRWIYQYWDVFETKLNRRRYFSQLNPHFFFIWYRRGMSLFWHKTCKRQLMCINRLRKLWAST
jgi:lipopolysaccharide biosynthesis glycosyltransferase